MANYGLDIINADGVAFLGDEEDTMMYYGRMYVDSNWKSVFDIPSGINVALFFCGDLKGMVLDQRYSNGILQARVLKEGVTNPISSSNAGEIYVFVHSVDYPRDAYTYGLEIYKANGDIQYFGAASAMKFQTIITDLYAWDSESSDLTTRPAVLTMYTGTSGTGASPNNIEWSNYTTAWLHSAGVWRIATNSVFEAFDDFPIPTSFAMGQYINVPSIDTEFFDNLPIRGNWS